MLGSARSYPLQL